MCGRYAFYLPPDDLKRRLGLENLLNIPPRYNCGPIQKLPIVVKSRMGMARWGFRPEWAQEDDPGVAAKMINARSESMHEKPAYRDSWAQARRCLVPANGFYEWSKDEESGVKQAYYIRHGQSDMLYFAGLWSKAGADVSFTILTKQADDNLSHLHHRSPVMIDESDAPGWFGGDLEQARDLIVRSSTRVLEFHPVSADVGKVANDHEGLIEPVSDQEILREAGRLL